MTRPIRRLTLVLTLLLMGTLSAQYRGGTPNSDDEGEWHFARLVYEQSSYGRRRGGNSFDTDYPDAEIHLRQGLERLTRIDLGGDTLIRPVDENIMSYPWLYAVEVGHWYLDDDDAAMLREYLLRGGFLMVDDFWGDSEWAVFEESMLRVFPDRPIVEIPDTDPLMTLVYDVDKSIQIPGRGYIQSGVTWQNGGRVPYWRGIYDDDGRLMVAINFNMDLGDAWEHADDPWYPEPMTGLAIRYAVNYVLYAMTH